MNDEIIEIIFALKMNVFNLIVITQCLLRFCIIQLKNKMIIIEKRLIIDVTIIVATIIFKKHDFLIEWCREETHIIKITIIVLCDNKYESIWNFIHEIDLRIKKRRTTILRKNINECIIFEWWNISHWQFFLNAF